MNIEMIRAAAQRLEGHARVTPLLNAPLLDRIAGRRVLVKAECLQWTGSFKYRGAWAAVSALRGAKGVIAYSSGNHAQGVALAAAALQFPLAAPEVCSVIFGAVTPEEVRQNIAHFAAEIPAGFWSDLRGEGLIAPEVPLP